MRDTSQAYYESLWQTMAVLPDWDDRVAAAFARVIAGRPRYEAVAKRADVPWYFIGIIHEMEGGCDFRKQIIDGKPWIGEWESWGEATLHAMWGYCGIEDWSPPSILRRLELYNGDPPGYVNRDKNSPYLCSGSPHGLGVGKFVADGIYDPRAVSDQVGAALILRALTLAGATRGVTPVAEPLGDQKERWLKRIEYLAERSDAMSVALREMAEEVRHGRFISA